MDHRERREALKRNIASAARLETSFLKGEIKRALEMHQELGAGIGLLTRAARADLARAWEEAKQRDGGKGEEEGRGDPAE